MQLFLDLSALSSDAGPCGAAYRLLHHAGHRLTVQYVPAAGRAETLQRLTGHAHAPVLVTDAGDVIPGLRGIVEWVERVSPTDVSAPPAMAVSVVE